MLRLNFVEFFFLQVSLRQGKSIITTLLKKSYIFAFSEVTTLTEYVLLKKLFPLMKCAWYVPLRCFLSCSIMNLMKFRAHKYVRFQTEKLSFGQKLEQLVQRSSFFVKNCLQQYLLFLGTIY